MIILVEDTVFSPPMINIKQSTLDHLEQLELTKVDTKLDDSQSTNYSLPHPTVNTTTNCLLLCCCCSIFVKNRVSHKKKKKQGRNSFFFWVIFPTDIWNKEISVNITKLNMQFSWIYNYVNVFPVPESPIVRLFPKLVGRMCYFSLWVTFSSVDSSLYSSRSPTTVSLRGKFNRVKKQVTPHLRLWKKILVQKPRFVT